MTWAVFTLKPAVSLLPRTAHDFETDTRRLSRDTAGKVPSQSHDKVVGGIADLSRASAQAQV